MATGGGDKSEQIKKQELLKEINQLQIKIQSFEKEKSTHLYGSANAFKAEFSQLKEMDEKLQAEIKTEKARMVQQLNKIRNMVKKFHRELMDVKPTPEFVEKLKVIMEDIEKQISDFKDQQRQHYEELMRDERTTQQEVATFEKRMETWSQQKTILEEKTARVAPLSHRADTRDLPPEVLALERFLHQTGGVRGGWDEYDHGTFLRFRNRHKGRYNFMVELVPSLPTKTEPEIRQHEQWYQEYLILNDNKKEAIEKWREKKQIEKEQELAEQESDSEEEEERLHSERMKELIEKERHVKQAQLNKWRVERELEKAENEEQRLRQEMMKSRLDEKKKQQQLLVKSKVSEYKQIKKENEQQKRLEQEVAEMWEAEARKKQAAEIIPKFQQRDKGKIEKRLTKEKSQQAQELEKQKQMERIKQRAESGVRRDPNRILKLTTGWKERKKQAGPSGTGPVLHMPHRAVPSWRQGMH